MRVKSFTESVAKKNIKSAVYSNQNELSVADSIKDNKFDNHEFENFQDHEVSIKKNCQHLNKAVNNLNSLKKILKNQTIGQCTSCLDLKNKGHNIQIKRETTLWLCLSCGHQGCDRSTDYKHALKHYQTPRSALHCVVLNSDSFVIWYEFEFDF